MLDQADAGALIARLERAVGADTLVVHHMKRALLTADADAMTSALEQLDNYSSDVRLRFEAALVTWLFERPDAHGCAGEVGGQQLSA
ncbi:hypothetical protein [Marinivivus vitaminiproducens]|uniref:hypothetical protein n=1 Tax=Marinivivus vitaminiproducens TaxID=3035935 RepID=UPI00279F5117|nr:hypothetical protein P4R82_03815 [Geminicoccaceae bacterium SCSIO 64248]